MDLYGPMCVASVNGKKCILVIVDDYSRFTWVKCLSSKDEALNFIIKFLKMIQLRLKAHVRRIRTDNGTEFINQTIHDYYEKVGISHETSVARSSQQDGVIDRQAVAAACYTQNRSIIRLRHGKTPYELLHDKLPDLSFLHVFGALCYPTNDSENLGKLQLKADIDFDELKAMAFEHISLEPVLHEMTPATSTPEVIALIAKVVAPEPAASTGSPSSTTVDQDAPSPNVAHMNNDPFFGILIPNNDSEASSSSDVEPYRHQISLIKEHGENGVIELYFVNTEYQLANIFTKPLARERIEFLINKLGMRSFTPETVKQMADEVDE
ncbi:retrovirus-related pol polyprotein from transposon TNT 1-94 [Tanacetum coccineum]